MRYLLDTNVVSELRKAKAGKADSGVTRWAQSVSPTGLYISAITVMELEIGILRLQRRDPVQGAILRKWMGGYVLPSFEGRILEIDVLIAMRCARFHVPDPSPDRDALIAATALEHGLVVVTRNTADFDSLGLDLLNPWSG